MMEILWTPIQLAVVWGIVSVGALVHGSVGMGLGLITVPFLLQVDPVFVPGPILAAGILLHLLMVRREHQQIDFTGLGWGVAGRFIGTVIASITLSQLPQQTAAITAALAILVAVGLSLSGLSLAPRVGTLLGAGTISGIMGTLASVGGPPMALLFQGERGPRLRATMAGYFLMGTLISLLGLVFAGTYRWAEAWATVLLFPAILLGYWVSGYALEFLDRGRTRGAVLAVSAVSSIVLLLRTLG